MNRRLFPIILPLLLVACDAPDGSTPGAAAASDAPQAASVEGHDAYQAACARCHDDGTDGAPVTGNPEDWSNRSRLWQAVLMQHVKAGYLQMPARGGQPHLTDRTVELATDYMLTTTFPERPPD